MKVAVSIPDPIFADTELLVKQLGTSRSEVYARALREFVGHHAPNSVTQAMNDVVDELAAESHGVDTFSQDTFRAEVARRAFRQTEW